MGSLMIFGGIMPFIQVCFHVRVYLLFSSSSRGRVLWNSTNFVSFPGSFRGHVVHYQLSRRRDR